MKATLTFDLYEERSELADALNGGHYSAVLEDLDEWLRKLAKYENKSAVKIEDARAKIRELRDGELFV